MSKLVILPAFEPVFADNSSASVGNESRLKAHVHMSVKSFKFENFHLKNIFLKNLLLKNKHPENMLCSENEKSVCVQVVNVVWRLGCSL